MVGVPHDSIMWWTRRDPRFHRAKTQSEVTFDEERNALMSWYHGSNQINMFGLQDDVEYVEETDTRDKPL
jgi:hypothetical protein